MVEEDAKRVIRQMQQVCKDVDEDSVVHVMTAINGGELTQEEVLEMMDSITAGAISQAFFNESIWPLMKKAGAKGEQGDDEHEPVLLTKAQLGRLNHLDQNTTVQVASPASPKKIKPKSPKGRKGNLKKSSKKQADQQQAAEVLPKDLIGDKQFHSKRFQRFHQTWMGNDSWTVGEHAMSQTVEELDDDDYSSAWLECLRLGIPWGGRGAGGRGVQRVTGQAKDVWVPMVSMARNGRDLLECATLKLVAGKRYCITGRNGCGKSTLLRRIAVGALPGFPPWLRVQYVEQEIKGSDLKPVDYVLKHDFERTRLLQEEGQLLEALEGSVVENDDTGRKKAAGRQLLKRESSYDKTAEDLQCRLSEVHERLDQIDAWEAESRAEAALRKVGFSNELLEKPTSELSGGWRMRCALCGTLFMEPDVLLLDEPTNALDSLGVDFLKQYLGNRENFSGTVLLVSHDRSFINAVTDELIVFRNKQLTYFPGNYDEFREMIEMKRAGQANGVAKLEKKKAELKDYINTQQRAARDKKSKGGDSKKQKQIGSKKKKLERIERMGLGRADGKYWKYHDCQRGVPLAVDFDEKPLPFKFPDAAAPAAASKVLIQAENVAYGWQPESPLVKGFTAQITGNCRIGVVGPNGVGKSSLVSLLRERLSPLQGTLKNSLPSQRAMSIFSQDMVNELQEEANGRSAVDLVLAKPRGASTVNCETVDQARTYLGGFGIHGDLATRPVETLSGGQKSRVVFALESYNLPGLAILDEPTAHLDLDSQLSLEAAIQSFNGAAVIVSHDVAFLAETCSQLWVFDPKTKRIRVCSPAAGETHKEFVNKTWAHFIKRNT